MTELAAVDSNIILYGLDEEDSSRKIISLELISEHPYFSSQSLSEVINACRKRWHYDKYKLIGIGDFLLDNCFLIPVDNPIIIYAHHLIKKYDLQYFDALIIASALHADCNILYSEDMQNGLTVEKQLTILNPFL